MLVLTRRLGEELVLSDGRGMLGVISVERIVTGKGGDKVRLGLEFPASIAIHRREVVEAVLRGDEGKKGEVRG